VRDRRLHIVLGLVLGLALCWYLFRGTDIYALWEACLRADPRWLLLGLVLVFLSFVCRVQRWSYIVRSAQWVSFRTLFNATQIGFLANFTLPGRVGEVVRAAVLTQRRGIPIVQAMAFVVLDRLTDLFGLVVAMLIAMIPLRTIDRVRLPEALAVPSWAEPLLDARVFYSGFMAVSATLVGLMFFCLALYLRQVPLLRVLQRLVAPLGERWRARILRAVSHFADGLHVLTSARNLFFALLWSLITWGTGAWAYYCLMRAYGIVLPWHAGVLLIVMLSLAISVPGAPGFIGQFHFGVILGVYMVAPDTPITEARVIALLAHGLNLFAVLVTGVYALISEGFGLRLLRNNADPHIAQEQAPNASPPAP